MSETVNHPDHYKTGNYECIDVMREVFGKEATQTFCKLNAFKYLWREDEKGGIEDLQKAAWYLNTFLDMEFVKHCDDPEKESEEDQPGFGEALVNLFYEVTQSVRDFNDPHSDRNKRYAYFKKMQADGKDDKIAFFLAAFSDLSEDNNEQ